MRSRFVLLLLILVLLWPLPGQTAPAAQLAVTWRDPAHVFVSWRQEIGGRRCLSKQAPGGAVYDYGCFWFFGQVGLDIGIDLPFGSYPPADAYPLPGDTIVVDDAQVVVGPQQRWLPIVMR
jgi:hypothetical protein